MQPEVGNQAIIDTLVQVVGGSIGSLIATAVIKHMEARKTQTPTTSSPKADESGPQDTQVRNRNKGILPRLFANLDFFDFIVIVLVGLTVYIILGILQIV